MVITVHLAVLLISSEPSHAFGDNLCAVLAPKPTCFPLRCDYINLINLL